MAHAGTRLSHGLDDAGFDPAVPTTWIWEGVLPYLTDAQVHATLDEVRASSAPGSQLIATYSTKLAVGGAGTQHHPRAGDQPDHAEQHERSRVVVADIGASP